MPAKPVRPLTPAEVAQYAAAIRTHPDTTDLPPQPAVDRSQMHASIFIAATATVKGRVVAGAGSSVFFSNALDAGTATITIGEKTNIQDNTLIRCSGDGFRIGRESTIGHNVLLEDCTIGDHSLIGIGSTVAKGTTIGNHVLLAAGARTEEGQVLEDGFLYVGTPARKRIPLDQGKKDLIASTIWTYCHYSQVFKAAQSGEPGPAPLKRRRRPSLPSAARPVRGWRASLSLATAVWSWPLPSIDAAAAHISRHSAANGTSVAVSLARSRAVVRSFAIRLSSVHRGDPDLPVVA